MLPQNFEEHTKLITLAEVSLESAIVAKDIELLLLKFLFGPIHIWFLCVSGTLKIFSWV